MFGARHKVERLEQRVREQDRVIADLCRRLGIDRESVDPGGAASPQERALVAEGKQILAIKTYRERTGAGLREAKAAIDEVSGGV